LDVYESNLHTSKSVIVMKLTSWAAGVMRLGCLDIEPIKAERENSAISYWSSRGNSGGNTQHLLMWPGYQEGKPWRKTFILL